MDIHQHYKNLVSKNIENKINNKIIIDIVTFTISLGFLALASILILICLVMLIFNNNYDPSYLAIVFLFTTPSIVGLTIVESIDILKDLTLNDKTFAYIYFFYKKVKNINEKSILKYLNYINIYFARRYVTLNLSKIRYNLINLFIYTDEDSITKSNLLERIRVVLSLKTVLLIKNNNKQLIIDLIDCLLNLYGIVLTLIENKSLTESEKTSHLTIQKKLLGLLSEIEAIELPANKNIIIIASKIVTSNYFAFGVLLLLTLIIIKFNLISNKTIQFISIFSGLITIWGLFVKNNQNKPKD